MPRFQGRLLRFASSYCKDILRLTKSAFFFFLTGNKNNVEQHHRTHCNEIWNMGYWNLEAEYQIARSLFLKWKYLRLLFSPTCGRVHRIANRNIQAHFGLCVQVPVVCQIWNKNPKLINLSGCQILGIPTTGNVWCSTTFIMWLTLMKTTTTWIIIKTLLNQTEHWFETHLMFSLK